MFDATNALNLVRRQIENGQCQNAISTAKQAIKQFPNDGRLWESAGIAYHEMADLESALQMLESATTLSPLTPEGQLVLAECYFDAGMPETANAILDHLVEQFFAGDLSNVYATPLVLCLAMARRYELAIRICEKSYQTDPTNGHACYGVAWYTMQSDSDDDKTMWWLEKAVELQPENTRYRITLGYAHVLVLDIQAARHAFGGFSLQQISTIKCRNCLGDMIEFLTLYGEDDRKILNEMKHQLVRIRHEAKGEHERDQQ